MRKIKIILMISVLFPFLSFSAVAQCPSFMVESGSTCVDEFEATLWKITNPRCIALIKKGKAITPLCLEGATEVGQNGTDYVDAECNLNGGGCKNIFALSLPHRIPAHTINYFIAAAACRNSGKRLPSNAEWQAAALGTPDPWPQDHPVNECNLSSAALIPTGAHNGCVSDVGAYDMVGNVIEFVADWGPLATAGNKWDSFMPGFGNDVSNMGGAPAGPIYGLPGTTLRGGSFLITPNSGGTGEFAGVYAIDQNGAPNSSGDFSAAGFRCAK